MKTRCEKSFLKEGDLEKINTYAARELAAEEIYIFTATLCDNDIDRDFEKFSRTALDELAVLFEGKTVIADHSMRSADQRARIFETYVEEQKGKKTADGEPLFSLKGRAYMLRNEENSAMISAIDAGIKKEGSVSCSMKKHRCSICGKDRRRERCEHLPSRSYGGKLCYTILSDAEDAYEFSFVAVPAQKQAGVTKTFHRTEEFDMKEMIKTIKSCGADGVWLSQPQAAAFSAYLEQLEDEARLGEEYKRTLSKSVVGLLKEKLPDMDETLLQSVVSVMTAQELIGFNKGLKKSLPAAPQIMPMKEKSDKKDYSQFKI